MGVEEMGLTHEEFHTAINEIAGDECCATRIEMTSFSSGETTVSYQAYIAGAGSPWSDTMDSPEAAIMAMRRSCSPEAVRAALAAKIEAMQAELAALEGGEL